MTRSTVSGDVREKVIRSRNRFWRPEDFGGSQDAVAQALSRLARGGELRRIRRGLYWKGSSTALGMAPPPTGRLASEVVDELGSGPAGWSAALVLGLSTQVPRHETLAVPNRAPRVTGSLRFVSRSASTRRRDERLSSMEVALLEVLRDWNGLVEVPTAEALTRIDRLVASGSIRLERIVRASATEPPRVRERLRQLLRGLGHESHAARVHPARSEPRDTDIKIAS